MSEKACVKCKEMIPQKAPYCLYCNARQPGAEDVKKTGVTKKTKRVILKEEMSAEIDENKEPAEEEKTKTSVEVVREEVSASADKEEASDLNKNNPLSVPTEKGFDMNHDGYYNDVEAIVEEEEARFSAEAMKKSVMLVAGLIVFLIIFEMIMI